jgi:tetratricopeptide (TPR) repeat protein
VALHDEGSPADLNSANVPSSPSTTGAPAEAASPCPDDGGATASPETWLTYFKSGQRSYSEGDYAQACRAFGRAIEKNEDNYYLHYMLGISYWKDGRTERATGPLNRSIELRPGFAKGWVNLARARRELGDPQEAIALCEKAIAVEDTSGDAWNVAGLSHLDLGEREAAIECFTNAIAVNAENPFALNNLGLSYIYEERFEEALLPLEEAARIAPGVAFIRNNLGVVYERLGRAADAARQYAAAMDTPSGHPRAEQSLKRVLPLLTVEEEATLAEFYQVEK